MRKYVAAVSARLQKEYAFAQLIKENKITLSKYREVPKYIEQKMLDECEKLIFCDICMALIEREIEIFSVNNQVR